MAATRQDNRTRTRPHPAATRVPPHDLDAERELLGTMLVGRDAIDTARSIVTPADYYATPHGDLHRAILELADNGTPPSAISAADRMAPLMLDALGGHDTIRRLLLDAPGTTTAAGLAHIVARHARHRRIITTLGEIETCAYNGTDPPGALLEQLTDHATLGDAHNLVEDDLAAISEHGDDVDPAVWLPVTGATPLIYAGRVHDLHGEPNSGKTWIAYAVLADVLAHGRNAVWIDWEDNAATFIARAHAIGIPLDTIIDPTRVRYLRPVGPLGPPELAALAAILNTLEPALVVLDALAGALATDGLDENSNTDFTTWAARVLRPIARHGAAVLTIDHVARNPDTRTRGGRGASAKLAFYDGASYEITATRPFSRQHAGEIRLKIAKDRPGHIGPVGHTAALATITPHDGTVELAFRAHTPSTDAAGRFVPTHLMEKISRHLETLGPDAELSKRAITDAVTGKNDYLRAAIDRLAETGHLAPATREGRGGGTVYRLLQPYREPDQNDHAE